MTPDQYRREGAEAMRKAALYQCVRVPAELPGSPRMAFELGLYSCESAIRAIDVDEVLAGLRPRCAECDCEDGNCTWIKDGPASTLDPNADVLAKVEVGDAPFTALSKFASKAAADVARWKARAEAAEAERDEARATIEAYGREKVREGMQRAADIAEQCWESGYRYQTKEMILAAMETDHDHT